MTEKGIPNLDAMDEDELREVARALNKLNAYIWWTVESIHNRKIGSVQRALNAEKIRDKYYGDLPDWAKW